jgi:3-methylcrotonyl-CoA carboxylase alpha subunit
MGRAPRTRIRSEATRILEDLMFRKILIANRGEIGCRIAATASRLGIRTVAVYSDADRTAKHVEVCDEAVHIGAAPAAESYLRIEPIIRAATSTGAQAIHPGYGFLAENEAFAIACNEADLTFIGPPPSAIQAMGNKIAAKELMMNAGVPLLPGYHGKSQNDLKKRAAAIGYPVLLKASAGGGGKGMRMVEQERDFDSALVACRREAKNSFGNESLLIEKYLPHSRHIEIQVFADAHGNYVHLFERDCSIQRRYQKIVEEAPAPGLTPELRRSLGETAIAAARAVGYIGAGTVEFLVDQDAQFYFMEMNTRLQVEHPVTEMITGHDLVEWQLRVAAGMPLPVPQNRLTIHGHAIEARIYAENPDKHFLPSVGTLRILKLPEAVEFEIGRAPAPVRVDSGVRAGDLITPYYDPMIAKLIVWGIDRTDAVARLGTALSDFVTLGLQTNRAFLSRLVSSSEFVAADFDTNLINRTLTRWLGPDRPVRFAFVALATAALLKWEEMSSKADPADPFSPWRETSGWWPNVEHIRTLYWRSSHQDIEGKLTYSRRGYLLQTAGDSALVSILEDRENQFVLLADSVRISGRVHSREETFVVVAEGEQVTLQWIDPVSVASYAEHPEGNLSAPMPGKIVAVLIRNGQTVTKGAPLITMEAMKMEHTIVAVEDGVVDEVLFNEGDQVDEGALLLRFSPTRTR